MSKLQLLTSTTELIECLDILVDSNLIAVDTEFLREKTYYPLLCLIQIHGGGTTYGVDAIEIDDLTPLHRIFSRDNCLKIFHACQQDLEALDQRLDHPLSGVYDTQIAAAFCGYGDQISYAGLVESVSGIKLSKSHTRTDWSARPLTPDQMQYASDDVNYLDDIRLELDSQLTRLGRNEWHQIECRRIVEAKGYEIEPEDAWKRLKNGAKLPINNQPVAKALSIWRERKAQKRNRPREWILSSRSLIDICYRQPSNITDLAKIESVNHSVVRNSGQEILNVLRDGLHSLDDPPIWDEFEPLNSEQMRQVKAIMGTLKQMAEDANISQSLIANRRDIEKLVGGGKDIPLLNGWRFDFVGRSVVEMYL